MNWIKCNLPWFFFNFNFDKNYPKSPDLTEEIKKIFGHDPDELYEKTENDLSKYYEYCVNRKMTKAEIKDDKLGEMSEIDLMKKYHGTEPKVQKALKYFDLRDKITAWKENHPDYIKYSKELEEANKKEEQKSFCGKGLNKTGTLIEIEEDGRISQLLIGDINEIAGVCDDCPGFNTRKAIVKRYKVIFNKE